MNIGREHKPGLEKVLAVVESRTQIRKSGMIDGHILQRDLHSWIAAASEAPIKTSSHEYRAELYDEMLEKAKSLGFGNIIGALTELETFQKVEVQNDSQSADIQHFVNLEANAAPEQEAVACRYRLKDGDRAWTYREGDVPVHQAHYERELLYTHPSAEIERLRAENKRLAAAVEYNKAPDDAEFGPGHPVFEMADETDKANARASLAEQRLAEAQALLRDFRDAVNTSDVATRTTSARKRLYSCIDRADTLLSATAQPAKENDQYELITNLTAIIDEELMPHAHKLPIQNLQRLNETLMDARKALK